MAAHIDRDAFSRFERDAHDRIAGTYNDVFASITDNAIDPLLAAVEPIAGRRLLDVATGPGRLARAAANRGAVATGSDLAPAMVELARRSNPGMRRLVARRLPVDHYVID